MPLANFEMSRAEVVVPLPCQPWFRSITNSPARLFNSNWTLPGCCKVTDAQSRFEAGLGNAKTAVFAGAADCGVGVAFCCCGFSSLKWDIKPPLPVEPPWQALAAHASAPELGSCWVGDRYSQTRL